MKKMALITTMILCLVLTACGNKEESQTTQEEVTVENTVVEEIPEEVVEETEEVETTVEEENIGDVDVSAEGLTMADMQELELGLDMFVQEIDEGTKDSFAGFKLLFPGGFYQTRILDGTVAAEMDSIAFIMDFSSRKADAPTSAREERNETLETIGKYVVHKIPYSDGQYGAEYSYRIYDTESGKALFVSIIINKNSEYQEYGDNLVSEYLPAFEEVLYNNLK